MKLLVTWGEEEAGSLEPGEQESIVVSGRRGIIKVTPAECMLLQIKWLYEFQCSASSLGGVLEAVGKKSEMPKVFGELCSPLGS